MKHFLIKDQRPATLHILTPMYLCNLPPAHIFPVCWLSQFKCISVGKSV